MTDNKYTIGSYEQQFHQFSFSTVDEHITDWMPGCEIKGKKIPAKITDDTITVVINEPNFYDRPWYNTQTEILMGFYQPKIKQLAKKYNLKQLHISIEPNNYGTVMLALSTAQDQEAELKSLIAEVFLDGDELKSQMPYEYEDFIFAHMRLNGDWDQVTDYDTEDDYVEMMKEATECAGYKWDHTDVEEWQTEWQEANQQEEA